MPTFEKLPRFQRDYELLSPEEKERFRQAVARFVEDLERGGRLRSGLRVKRVQGTPGIHEMTWAPDGRATFEFGEPVRRDEVHVRWRRIGRHDIFGTP
jgi:hypothetical protein